MYERDPNWYLYYFLENEAIAGVGLCKVYEFPSESLTQRFLSEVGGAIHPFGGMKTILRDVTKSPETAAALPGAPRPPRGHKTRGKRRRGRLVPYVDTLDADTQISLEEQVASIIFKRTPTGDEKAALLGRRLVYVILRKARPDLFVDWDGADFETGCL